MAATTTNRSLTQYSGDTPSDLFIRDVDDWLSTLQERQDTPFSAKIGTAPAPDVPKLKSEFGWSSPDPVEDTLAVAISSTGATTFTPTNVEYYSVGRVLVIDNEHLTVEGVQKSPPLITVKRGHAGTTAATHLLGATVHLLAPALIELEDDPLTPVTQGEIDYNYPQILSFSWRLSNRARVTPTYESRRGTGDRDAQELRKKMRYTAPLALERQLLFGLRDAGSTTTRSTLGGLAQPSFITTRSAVSGPLTEYDLMQNLQTVWQLVGGDAMGKVIMGDMFAKRIINSWYNSSRRSASGDTKISVNFDTISTDMGDFKFQLNWQYNNRARVDVLNFEDFKRRPYASNTGWQSGKIATQGWYTHAFLRGDFTLIPQRPDTRLSLSGYSLTPGDYPGIA
jgi:hypothetical protein